MAGNHKHIGEFGLSFSFWWVYKSWFGSWKLSWCGLTWKGVESYYLFTFNYIPTTGDFTKLKCAWGFSSIHPRWPPGCANVGTWLGQLRCTLGQPCVTFQVGKKGITNSQIPRDDLVGSWVERWNLGWNLVVFDEISWNHPNSKRHLAKISEKKDAGPSKGVLLEDGTCTNCQQLKK